MGLLVFYAFTPPGVNAGPMTAAREDPVNGTERLPVRAGM
jgi:hypothetical protein